MAPTAASSTAITLNLITMGLGTGLLTMPWGTAGASIATSMFLLGIVLLLNYWTVMILVRGCEKYQEFDLGALLRHLPGSLGLYMERTGNTIIWGSQFLVLLGYNIVVIAAFHRLLPKESFWGRREVAGCLMGAVVFPLSLLEQKYLAWTSTISIVANIYLVCLLVFEVFTAESSSEHHTSSDSRLCVFGFSDGTVTQFSLLMYTIIIQMAIPPMYQELEDRSPQKFARCLKGAFVALFLLFTFVMVGGYIVYGPSVQSSLLDSLPDDMWGSLARFSMAVCMLGCYPLNVKPMVAPFLPALPTAPAEAPLLGEAEQVDETQQQQLAQRGRDSRLITVVIVSIVTLFSFWVTDLGPLNAINGAIQVSGYIGLIPGITGLMLLGEISLGERIALLALISFAAISSMLGLIFIENDVAAMERSCLVSW